MGLVVTKAADAFYTRAALPNEMWQTDCNANGISGTSARS
jgi:hypothetical protein